MSFGATPVALDTWIKKALIQEFDDAKCTRLLCLHESCGNEEIKGIQTGGDLTPAQLAQMFIELARTASQTFSEPQKFKMLAYYGDRTEPQDRYRFTVEPSLPTDGLVRESPDAKGIFAQGMKFSEATLLASHRKDQVLFEQQFQFTSMVMRNNLDLVKANQEKDIAISAMSIALAEAKHTHTMQEMEFKRSSEERRILLQLVPELINRVTGSEVFPQGTADTAIWNVMAQKMSEQDYKMLMTFLETKDKQLAALIGGRLQKALKESNDQQAQIHQLTKGVDPEDDAAGGNKLTVVKK